MAFLPGEFNFKQNLSILERPSSGHFIPTFYRLAC